jgi:hypothetical protein
MTSATSSERGSSGDLFGPACARAAVAELLTRRSAPAEDVVCLGPPGLADWLLDGASVEHAFSESAFLARAARYGRPIDIPEPFVLLGGTEARLTTSPVAALALSRRFDDYRVDSLNARLRNTDKPTFLLSECDPGLPGLLAGLEAGAPLHGLWALQAGDYRELAQALKPLGGAAVALTSDGFFDPLLLPDGRGADIVWFRDEEQVKLLRGAASWVRECAEEEASTFARALENSLGSGAVRSAVETIKRGAQPVEGWPEAGFTGALRVRRRAQLEWGSPPPTRKWRGAHDTCRLAPRDLWAGLEIRRLESNGQIEWRWVGPGEEACVLITPLWPGWMTLNLEIWKGGHDVEVNDLRLHFDGVEITGRLSEGVLAARVWVSPDQCGVDCELVIAAEKTSAGADGFRGLACLGGISMVSL